MLDFSKNVKLLVSSLAWLKRRDGKSSMGFTLVELSIVIVIIGLLVGGVTAGQSLVKQARLRSLATQITSLNTAWMAFKLQYNAIPGDFNNAYAYWGANCAASSGLCNGTGNRRIETVQESIQTWVHFSLSGLIDGKYISTPTTYYLPGVNHPKLPFSSQAGIGIRYMGGYSGGKRNMYEVGAVPPGASKANVEDALLTTQDASYFDIKMDDGLPSYGKIRVARGWNVDGSAGRCVSSNVNATSVGVTYVLTDTLISCRVYFYID